MSNEFKLIKFGYIGTIGTIYGNYAIREYFKFVTYDKLKEETHAVINDRNPVYKMCISACISSTWLSLASGKFWLKKPKYFMVLDCDSQEDSRRIMENLTNRQIDYIRVPTGTQGHYWFFCNKIGTIDELIPIMKQIPGCDQRYVDHCRRNNSIHVRAFPKNGITPRVDRIEVTENEDIFVKVNDASAKSFKGYRELCKWIKEFRQYWLSYARNGENSIVALAQANFLNNQMEEIVRQDTILVQAQETPVTMPLKYFNYDRDEINYASVSESIDLKVKDEKHEPTKQEVIFDPIGDLEL